MQEAQDTRREEAETSAEETSAKPTVPLGEVEKLVGLLKRSGVGEISVKSGDLEVSVKARPERANLPETFAPSKPEPEEAAAASNGYHAVRSPLVGTFYRAPAPNEGSYVEVGDRVRAGQTLCIVEAMKLMNEIPADVSGEVVEVLVENASGVEYDQPLFSILPEE